MSLQVLAQAPPVDAPPGIDALIGWTLAAQFWHCHLPIDVSRRCGRCGCRWPCWSSQFADAFLLRLRQSEQLPPSAQPTAILPTLKDRDLTPQWQEPAEEMNSPLSLSKGRDDG